MDAPPRGAWRRVPAAAAACYVACLLAAPPFAGAVLLQPQRGELKTLRHSAGEFRTHCDERDQACVIKDFAMRVLMLPITGVHRTPKPPGFDMRSHVTQVLGLPFESHAVVSRDGYKLTMHRLPNPGAPPVLLVHGMMETSGSFLASTKNSSLGPLLHRNGYDVWMGNHRGNLYSKGHTNPALSDMAYWNFTALDMGRQDLPAFVDHALLHNGAPSLTYVGHSLGGEMAFAAFSDPKLSQELHRKIHLITAIAPAVTVHFESAFKAALPLLPLVEMLQPFDLVGGLHLTHDLLTTMVCRELACDSFAAAMFLNSQFDDYDAIRRSFNWYPSCFGSKVLAHILQTAKHGDLAQEYDYGAERNMMLYKQETPPTLNLKTITVPTALLYGANDQLTGTYPSIYKTVGALRAETVVYQHRYPDLGHHSFNYADGAHSPHWWARDILHLLRLYPGREHAGDAGSVAM